MSIRRALWARTACTVPYLNLAREELLMKGVRPRECILYLWQNAHTVVVGRNQDCWKECDVGTLEAEGGHLARRLSGGGAVYHDLGNLNFSFITSKGDYDVMRQTRVILEACRSLGIHAEISGRNDLTVDGRKFSGSAFFHTAGRSCQHGTLLLRTKLTDMDRLLKASPEKLESNGVRSVRARVVNLCDYCPDITVDRMSEALLKSFSRFYDAPLEEAPLPDEKAIADRAVFYASDLWRLSFRRPTDVNLSRRFDWGEFQLYASVRNGYLSNVRAYSDAMECDFVNRLPQALEGVRYSAQALASAVFAAGGEQQMASDIANFLWKQVPPEQSGIRRGIR